LKKGTTGDNRFGLDPATGTPVQSGGATVAPAGLNGLGGWLVLVVIGQVAIFIKQLKGIVDDINVYKDVTERGIKAVNVELGLNTAMLLFTIVVTVTMFRKQRLFPGLWILQGVAVVFLPLLDTLIVSNILGSSFGSVWDEKDTSQLISSCITVSLWTWYLNKSVRVENTFVN
jgi:hypothetical protein